jgi:hypothetical protein
VGTAGSGSAVVGSKPSNNYKAFFLLTRVSVPHPIQAAKYSGTLVLTRQKTGAEEKSVR